MRRMEKLLASLLLLVCLCACRQQSPLDLSTFLVRWNAQEKGTLHMEDFYLEEGTQEPRCFVVLGEHLTLRLFSGAQNRLREGRLLLTKMTADGGAVQLSPQDYHSFYVAACVLYASFSGKTSIEAEQTLQPLSLSQSASLRTDEERVLDADDLHCVLLSNRLETVFILQDRWLNEIESTQKPENKAPFDATTATRSQTVPHK